MKSKKPKCYKSHVTNTCLGRITRYGFLSTKCACCKWVVKGQPVIL